MVVVLLLLLLLQPVLLLVAGIEQMPSGCYRGGNLSNIALTTRT